MGQDLYASAKETTRKKTRASPKSLEDLLKRGAGGKSALSALKSLGRLPENFDDRWIRPLAFNNSQKIRLWAVKTLGKSKNKKNLRLLEKSAKEDLSTEVRREAVSSIGRLKNKIIIPVLLELLNESDPKIILQAIRGLLAFKKETEVFKRLKKLSKHPNETVQKIIEEECFLKSKEKAVNKQSHSESHSFLKNTVVLGDVREILKHTPDESFHLTFTSPPYYNARDYSIYKSYTEYLSFLKEVFLLTHQKTKDGRFLIVNTSPIILPRVSRRHSSKRYPIPFDIHSFLVKIGWEFIDDIVWEKPESSVKNRNAGFGQHRKPLAYKPNPVTEYLMVYRKQTDRLIDWNIRQYDKAVVHNSKIKGAYESSNIWRIDPQHDKIHSAVFPFELCERVIKYYSFKGDLVFDPFAGSGTFGRAAKCLNRYFFLAEKNFKYFDYMRSFFSEERNLFDKHFSSAFLTLNEYAKAVET